MERVHCLHSGAGEAVAQVKFEHVGKDSPCRVLQARIRKYNLGIVVL